MATQTLADYPVTGAWTDLVATLGAAASVDVVVQNISTGNLAIVFGGASAPTATTSGLRLLPNDSVQGNAANIWVKAFDGSEKVTVTVL